jgi:hypothetical protein
MGEKMTSYSRAQREDRDTMVDAARRYGAWAVAALVLLPFPLAAVLLAVAALWVYVRRVLGAREELGL